MQALEALNESWDSLANATPEPSIFANSAWLRPWIRVVSKNEGVVPIIAQIFDKQDMIMGLALQHSVENRDRVFMLGFPWCDYAGLVYEPGKLRPWGVRWLVKSLRNRFTDKWNLSEVPLDSPLCTAWKELGGVIQPGTTVSSLDLADTATCHRLLSRKEYQIKWRRLCRLGEVACIHESTPGGVAAGMPSFIALHKRQWRDRNDVVAPFDGSVVDDQFRTAGIALAEKGMLLLTKLTLNGEPIAMYYGFKIGNWYGGYRTAYSLEYRKLSPGHLMLNRMIEEFPGMGIAELDFMRGDYPYKLHYTNKKRKNVILLSD
ncbi:MAG: GNAT family N-acetyltransferase [Desulfarculaceae bacterium]|nr:GNAT family N-acetyltransferase [Desulfarculaceae bacterium]